MDPLTATPPEQVVASLAQLVQVFAGESVDAAGFAARASPLGWTATSTRVIQTSLSCGTGRLVLKFADGDVVGGLVNLTHSADPDAEPDIDLNDAFARDAAALAERWGNPVGRR